MVHRADADVGAHDAMSTKILNEIPRAEGSHAVGHEIDPVGAGLVDHLLEGLLDPLSVVDIADCTTAHLLAASRGEPGRRYVVSGATVGVAEAVATGTVNLPEVTVRQALLEQEPQMQRRGQAGTRGQRRRPWSGCYSRAA